MIEEAVSIGDYLDNSAGKKRKALPESPPPSKKSGKVKKSEAKSPPLVQTIE
jgi:hypothetical protein